MQELGRSSSLCSDEAPGLVEASVYRGPSVARL